jgi:hypothetical protein
MEKEEKPILDRPFIAIRRDEEGEAYDPTEGEYLCNPLDEDMLDVVVSSGGFYTLPQVGVVEGNSSVHPTFAVRAGSAERFALSTREEYDEMVVHWNVSYRTAKHGEARFSVSSWKGLRDTIYCEDIPTLGGPGRIVRKPRPILPTDE